MVMRSNEVSCRYWNGHRLLLIGLFLRISTNRKALILLRVQCRRAYSDAAGAGALMLLLLSSELMFARRWILGHQTPPKRLLLAVGDIVTTITALLAGILAYAVDRAYQVWNLLGWERVVPPMALRPLILVLLRYELANVLMPLFKRSMIKLFEFD